VFGPETTAAVAAFQRLFGLTPDGIAGASTWYKIPFLHTALTRLAALDRERKRVDLGAIPPAGVVRAGARGEEVQKLRFLLNSAAAYYPSMPPALREGVFGPAAAASARVFQALFGLTPDGVVGPATWNALYDVRRGIDATRQAPPAAPPAASYPGRALEAGSRGESVRLVQRRLNALAAVNPSLPALTEDGSFGPATRAAVVALQRLAGLPPDGAVGEETWSRLAALSK
jgi:peptidoglycan hydrolase-like protein with peptidoglycan-binding domain